MNDVIDKIISLGKAMHSETGYSNLTFNESKARKYLTNLAESGQFFYVTDNCMMVAAITTPYFSDSRTAKDVLLYVDKDSRGKGVAKKAIKKYIEWAELNNADRISLGQSSGICGKEFKSLAGSLGFNEIGTLYTR